MGAVNTTGHMMDPVQLYFGDTWSIIGSIAFLSLYALAAYRTTLSCCTCSIETISTEVRA